MNAEASRIGNEQQRIVLAALAPKRFVVTPSLGLGAANGPAGHGRALLVIGEVLLKRLGPELELARRRIERPSLRIIVEAAHAGRQRILVRILLGEVEAMLYVLVPRNLLAKT